jgi:hypothetical protein
MKKIFFLVLLSASLLAQRDDHKKTAEPSYNLFISGGIHAGAWSAMGMKELPYNFQFDKVFKNHFLLGAGYTFDHYSSNIFAGNIPAIRQNLRLRFAWYRKDPDNYFSTYLGFSAGVSHWRINEGFHNQNGVIIPTLQFLFGLKMNINESMFWLTEFGVGAPYLMQTSIGFKF